MTFVILTAGIDLSIGSLVAFAGLVAAAVSKGGLSNRFTVGAGQEAASQGWYLAALAAIGVESVGATTGLAITRLKVPPFVVTLGGMSAWRGAALLSPLAVRLAVLNQTSFGSARDGSSAKCRFQ